MASFLRSDFLMMRVIGDSTCSKDHPLVTISHLAHCIRRQIFNAAVGREGSFRNPVTTEIIAMDDSDQQAFASPFGNRSEGYLFKIRFTEEQLESMHDIRENYMTTNSFDTLVCSYFEPTIEYHCPSNRAVDIHSACMALCDHYEQQLSELI